MDAWALGSRLPLLTQAWLPMPTLLLTLLTLLLLLTPTTTLLLLTPLLLLLLLLPLLPRNHASSWLLESPVSLMSPSFCASEG